MPKSSSRRSAPALLLIDVINHFEFPDAKAVLRHALRTAPKIAALKERVKASGCPVIYVNDNFGDWRSDAKKLLAYCIRPEAKGRKFVETLALAPDDYCILKPMHSAFYQTPLDTLLKHLDISTILLAGIATNSCILCTAHDAKMRDLEVVVLSDCCAARSLREHRQALAHFATMANARVVTSVNLRLKCRKAFSGAERHSLASLSVTPRRTGVVRVV
jgi:nicotinamidase-related amidase